MPRSQGMATSSSLNRTVSALPQVPEKQVDEVLEILRPLVTAVGATVGPHCEVVLHDLRVPEHSIVAIYNGAVTGRRVGGPVVGGPNKDIALKLLDSDVTQSTLSVGYKTHTPDSRELRSTSLVLRTPQGKPIVAFCVNIDLSAVTMARMLLDEISRTTPPDVAVDGPHEETAQTEVSEVIAQIIQEVLKEVGKPVQFMERDDRVEVVQLMHERGLFLIRGGVERAAAALGISRFTLYSYLKEVRST